MNETGYYKCHTCQKIWINQDQAKKRQEWCEQHKWPK